ncbi:MAG TPA: ComEC/Rec2 family competence protein [Chitinophagaceae bacterium]
MQSHPAHPWSKAPALRLLVPFITGVLVQWYAPLPIIVLIIAGSVLLPALLLYPLLTLPKRFWLATLQGTLLSLLIGVVGAAAVYSRDVRNSDGWIGHHLAESKALVLKLEEPLVEKPATWKAVATVESLIKGDARMQSEGKVILYFKKDSLRPALSYGSRIVVGKPLQEVRNSGNPGAFDYRRYSLFQGITHQVYLLPGDYRLLPAPRKSALKDLLFRSRQEVLGILKAYIPGTKEQGLAEALLIGYKDDLDKGLLLAYSNTGVVHVIAISGLHVGLIYGLLLVLTRPLKRKGLRVVRLLLLLVGLWGFGALAGAGASVMRSVVMFSFLAGAEVLGRRAWVYNTLALSAFGLLCYNPFWLWDVGFQLSYAAVGSILLFYGPINNVLYFPNKGVDLLWKMNTVTLSAQLFTTPLVLYHFHQFPTLFLLANLVAVPLSSMILMGEILLCAAAFLPFMAAPLGRLLSGMIGFMNKYIVSMENVSFAAWGGISISVVQAMLLTAIIAAAAWWLMERHKEAVTVAAVCAVLFLVLRTHSFRQAEEQHKLIVYNVPKHRAVDVIEGRTCRFIGDAALQEDVLLRNYHMQPSRVLHRVAPVNPSPHLHSFTWQGQQVLLIDSTVRLKRDSAQQQVDLLILSGNPKVYITTLAQSFRLRQVVADASVPRWKAVLWKRDCDSLRIPFYAVEEKGAFVLSR